MSIAVLAVVAAAAAAALAVPGVTTLRPDPSTPVSGVPVADGGTPRFRWLLSPVAGLGAGLVVGGLVGVVVGVAGALVTWHVLARAEPVAVRRRREQLDAMLPHVVDLMASSLTVGSSISAAVAMVAEVVDPPMRGELAQVTRRLVLGVDPVRVWSDVGGHPQLGVLGRSLVRALESGAPVAAAMHRLGEDLRRRNRAAVESRARAVGVRAAAPLGLCLLPTFILVGIVPLVAGSFEAVLHL